MKVILAGLLLLGFVSNAAQAAVLEQYTTGTATPTTIGSFAMTDFAYTGATTGTGTSVASPISGSLFFEDINGDEANMMLSTANYTDNDWWANGEGTDYDVYLTSQLHYVTIVLPENTRAFSFNVGANMDARGWLSATESTTGSDQLLYTKFTAGPGNAPGYGIYADKDSCSSITSVTIDPTFIWGFGNFSINQDSCTSVPETSSVFLFGLGLLGLLGLARRKV